MSLPRLAAAVASGLGMLVAPAANMERAFAQGIEFGPPTVKSAPVKPKSPAVQHLEPGASAPTVKAAGTNAALARQVPGPGTPNPLAAKYATSGLPPKAKPANCKNEVGFEAWLARFRKDAAAA
ncbi:MAG: hypothetical protein WBY12_11550, partial [Hyphomicrobium sp.]